jgi:inorganic pyrophosphatase
MIVVTSGARYIDIDAYACCVTYAELLNLLGKPAVAASTAAWNESITGSLRALNAPLRTDYIVQQDDQFIIVDLSDPTILDPLVVEDHIIEILDHHTTFEQYWADKLGKNSHIEFVGAAATLVFEKWQQAGKAEVMHKETAELLAAAILDNTLNFRASITTNRDKAAYSFLAQHAELPDDWAAVYFTECQTAILSNLSEALRNDTKFVQITGFDEKLCLGQIVVWDAKGVLAHELDTIRSTLSGMDETWMANVVSIADGKSYIVAQNEKVKAWIAPLLHITFNGTVATADRLWLRKEIVKADSEQS